MSEIALPETLVDTSPVEHLRAARNWKGVMAQASSLRVYDGVHELLNELHEAGETLAIVTKSPDMVAKAFVHQHKKLSWSHRYETLRI
jgi:phosphoglycolate phosphatase-like HAD superfamily hydrolase